MEIKTFANKNNGLYMPIQCIPITYLLCLVVKLVVFLLCYLVTSPASLHPPYPASRTVEVPRRPILPPPPFCRLPACHLRYVASSESFLYCIFIFFLHDIKHYFPRFWYVVRALIGLQIMIRKLRSCLIKVRLGSKSKL